MANWQPNDNQKKVLAVLKTATRPMTLEEIGDELGMKIHTGTTNTLLTKGLMVGQDIDIYCDINIHKTTKVIGHMTKHVKAYSLAKGE